jgi:hypothetical protein
MRRLALAFVLGQLSVLLVGAYMGGEVVTQIGLRMIGAQTRYDFQAVPRQVSEDVTPIHARKR